MSHTYSHDENNLFGNLEPLESTVRLHLYGVTIPNLGIDTTPLYGEVYLHRKTRGSSVLRLRILRDWLSLVPETVDFTGLPGTGVGLFVEPSDTNRLLEGYSSQIKKGIFLFLYNSTPEVIGSWGVFRLKRRKREKRIVLIIRSREAIRGSLKPLLGLTWQTQTSQGNRLFVWLVQRTLEWRIQIHTGNLELSARDTSGRNTYDQGRVYRVPGSLLEKN